VNRAVSSSSQAAWPVASRGFWIVRVATGVAGLGLQLAGLYALAATFGLGVTLALCGVGALAVLLQHIVVWRATCSSGE